MALPYISDDVLDDVDDATNVDREEQTGDYARSDRRPIVHRVFRVFQLGVWF